MKTCEDCYHFVLLGEGKNGKGETVEVGNCFRYPPVQQVSGGSAYPIVGAIERQCGEFAPLTKRKTTK